MIHHVVLLKFKPGVTAMDVEGLEKLLDDLPNKITEIHMYEFGRDLVRSERSYDFALIALFANRSALDRYQKHPRHLLVVKMIQELSESIVTADFESSDVHSAQ